MSKKSHRTWNEVLSLLLVGGGILLLLALLSFEPRDVPSWLFYAKYSSSSKIPLNFVGRFGAIVAGLSFFLFGGASFFIAAVLLGLGITTFFEERKPLGIRFGWAFIFVLSWAFFLDFLDHFNIFSTAWKQTLALPSAGGWFGHALGITLGKNSMGTVGSLSLFLVVAFISLILATGLHPIVIMKYFFRSLGNGIVIFFQSITKQLFKKPPLSEPSSKKTSSRQPRKKEIQETLSTFSLEETEKLLASNFPPPKIIDASIPAVANKKPSLAEVMKTKSVPAENTTLEKTISGLTLDNYTLPDLALLEAHQHHDHKPTDPAVLQAVQKILIETLSQFSIEVAAGDITKGPTITRYELYPAKGVRVDRIVNLERDLARATRAERINILAPIPGKDTVGIEIANSDKVKVAIGELFESEAWHSSKAKLPLALGKDVYGNAIIADLAQMPHLLVAGATGSGKSVCINSIITSLLFKHTPETLRFIMIDPKVVEMQIYNKLPHLVTPVVTDPKKVLLALRWVIEEMELRYKIFAKTGVRNITGFNARPRSTAEKKAATPTEEELAALEAEIEPGEEPTAQAVPHRSSQEEELIIPEQMPFIVVIVDELADLMQTAPADVESAIARITQMARAAGIHMIVATQTPRADVVTGIIKANIPTRIAFQVASKLDSRVILDQNGADRLLGQGDMLYLPPGSAKLLRAQGVLVTDEEIGRVVDFLGQQSEPIFEPSIVAKLSNTTIPEEDVTDAEEELVTKCLEIIRQEKKASTSMLQRRLRLGYTRAARIVDILEQRGILGPKDGARDREILVDLDGVITNV
ncbi:MAG: DNA translocase FtsK [Chthoniobacterales bacterium]|nr:DNA translocase FtsK [Chthoniobacterales bacterium]